MVKCWDCGLRVTLDEPSRLATVITPCGSSNICWNNTTLQYSQLCYSWQQSTYRIIKLWNTVKKLILHFFMGLLKMHTISASNSREHKMQNCRNWDFNVHYTENNWQKLFIRMNCHAIINWYIILLALLFNSIIRTNRVHNILWRRTVCLCFNCSKARIFNVKTKQFLLCILHVPQVIAQSGRNM